MPTPYLRNKSWKHMSLPISLKDITIYPVVEQQGAFFDVMEFFPTLNKDQLDENRSWLEPTFIDSTNGRLILCIQAFLIKTPRHNILIDSCVGARAVSGRHSQPPASRSATRMTVWRVGCFVFGPPPIRVTVPWTGTSPPNPPRDYPSVQT
jgi:hypothetical protein